MLGLGLTLTRPIIRHSDAVTDPLAGISFALRLQTHNGDTVPLGIYQDTACTIPADEEWDPVAAWRDELSDSGLVAIQANTDKQPLLVFESGVPTLLFDGVDDYLVTSNSTLSQPCSIMAVAQSSNNSGLYLCDSADTINARMVQFTSGPGLRVHAGSSLDQLGDVSVFQVLAAIFNGATSVNGLGGVEVTGNAGSSNGQGYTLASGAGGGGYMSGSIAAFVAAASALDAPTRTIVKAYLDDIYADILP
jgi:hypothetical protein